jgi:hypothetical protein
LRSLDLLAHRSCGPACPFTEVADSLDALQHGGALLEALAAQTEQLRGWRKERIRTAQDAIPMACALYLVVGAHPATPFAAQEAWRAMDHGARRTWAERAQAFAAHLLGEPLEFVECPGAGKCHGSMSWCTLCGNVSLLCDGEGQCHSHRDRWADFVAKKAP